MAVTANPWHLVKTLRAIVRLSFSAILCIVGFDSMPATACDPPSHESTSKLKLPDEARINVNSVPEDAELLQAIQAAIQGNGNRSEEPLFQDVYKLIESRGSLLRGSELEKFTEEASRANRQNVRRDPRGGRPQPMSSKVRKQRLRAAESLMKTARMIDKLGVGNQNRQKLVNQMLREAVSLLNEVVNAPSAMPSSSFTAPKSPDADHRASPPVLR
ncbi:MAG: hypothetical protein AAF802_03640 [Planctomycetota bacterium]